MVGRQDSHLARVAPNNFTLKWEHTANKSFDTRDAKKRIGCLVGDDAEPFSETGGSKAGKKKIFVPSV